jgi:hypothetical protein
VENDLSMERRSQIFYVIQFHSIEQPNDRKAPLHADDIPERKKVLFLVTKSGLKYDRNTKSKSLSQILK